MCGICGKVNLDSANPVDAALLQRMCDSIRHRGPDGEGFYVKDNVGLGMRRLAIIDLATGDQPIPNEDKSAWIVFNGEIYNYLELYQELRQRGHQFATRSDTEVILHAYEEWGVEACARLRGMFAYAIWDIKRQRLVVARDRLGKKPLIYTRTREGLLFGSELRTVLQDPVVRRELNPDALYAYMMRLYVPTPDTIFQGIHKLPPGHTLVLENGEISIRPYWEVDFSNKVESSVSEAELSEQLWTLMEDAVRVRLMSEVPLGAFLSGGVDSSAVVGIMSRLMDEPVKTFAIRFEEMGFDETPYARQVAELFHTEHREFTVRPSALEVLPKLVWHYGEPFADSSAIPTYYVSQVTRQYVTVALSGDAGDENFGGYDYYRAAQILESYRRVPAFLRRGALGLLDAAGKFPSLRNTAHKTATILRRGEVPPAEAYLNRHTMFSAAFAESFCQADLLRRVNRNALVERLGDMVRAFNGSEALDLWIYLDLLNYLPDDINVKVDIASMANSLEVRAPFLDHKVVEFAASLPAQMKLHGSLPGGMTTKYILKKSLERILPKDILYRRKHGFSVPISAWLRSDLRPLVHDTLLSPRALQRGYFRAEEVQRMVAEHENGIMDHGTRLWTLLNLELWQRTYMDELRDSALVL